MKTTVCFEYENKDASGTKQMLRQLRKMWNTDFLIVISAGDFLSDGIQTEQRAIYRAERLKEAGADLVLSLPVSSILGGYGKKEFASVALIQKLHAVDRVALFCRPGFGQSEEACSELLKACAMLIFCERPDYRGRLQELLKQQVPFRNAQMQAVAECIPEAAQLLKDRENRQTVRILDAMLQLYFLVEVEFVRLPKSEVESQGHGTVSVEEPEKTLAKSLKTILSSQPESYFKEIAGSTEKLILGIHDQAAGLWNIETLQDAVDLLQTYTSGPDMARLFLLRAMLRIRHSDMQISGLHTYVPYCHVLAWREEKTEEQNTIRKSSWVPFVWKAGQESLEAESPKETVEFFDLLLEIDRKAQRLLQVGDKVLNEGTV